MRLRLSFAALILVGSACRDSITDPYRIQSLYGGFSGGVLVVTRLSSIPAEGSELQGERAGPGRRHAPLTARPSPPKIRHVVVACA